MKIYKQLKLAKRTIKKYLFNSYYKFFVCGVSGVKLLREGWYSPVYFHLFCVDCVCSQPKIKKGLKPSDIREDGTFLNDMEYPPEYNFTSRALVAQQEWQLLPLRK